MKPRRLLVLAIAALLSPLVQAAGISVEYEERVRFIALHDASARCLVEEVGDSGVLEASCTAGDYYVTATAEFGCGDSFGPTYCGSIDPESVDRRGNELTCSDGSAYLVAAGTGEVRCKPHSDTTMSCENAPAGDYAEASCDGGCLRTRGAGSCCRVGTRGCP